MMKCRNEFYPRIVKIKGEPKMKKVEGISIMQYGEETYSILHDDSGITNTLGVFILNNAEKIVESEINKFGRLLLFGSLEQNYEDYLELIDTYIEKPKYYWKLKGFKKSCYFALTHGYNNYIHDSNKNVNFKYAFTEAEFKAICEEKGICFEAFEKEGI